MADSNPDPRQLVRQIAREYLETEAPEQVEELEVVFDSVYRELTEGGAQDQGDADDPREMGFPIDAAFLDGTLVSSVLWITVTLVREALERRRQPDVSERLSRLETLLAKSTGQEEQTRDLLGRVLDRVVRGSGGGGTASSGAPPAAAGSGGESKGQDRLPGPAADLQLFVSRGQRDGKSRLGYKLHSERLGLVFEDYGSIEIELDPLAYFKDLLHEIEELPVETAAEQKKAETRLRARGAKLFHSLLPELLREKLWEFLDSGRVRTLQVVSDEPWIPWELLRFQGRRGDSHASGPFWSEAFVLTRWLPGATPASTLPLLKMALVVAGDAGLPQAEAERKFLLSLEGEGRTVREVPARFSEVIDALASGEHDSWHFTCHGAARGTDADRWPLRLEDYDDLTPDDLQGDAAGLGKAKPLFFLNACQTGRGGMSLTNVGGWAAGLLNAGAGAFVGPLWSIRDSRALAFAQAFYRELLAGETLGEAAHKARQELREQFPGDPSGLGYVLYAQPHAATRSMSEPLPPPKEQKRPELPKPQRKRSESKQRPSSEPEPGAQRLHEKDGTVLVYVPGGTYTLGAEDVSETARPVHRVRLSPFWIGKYPVTNEQYKRFLKENPEQREPELWDDEAFNQPWQPVVGVSWAEAEAYCRWAGLRLPSEAQWEAAARGQEGRRYPWGDVLPTSELANFGGKAGGPTPVDSHSPGAGPFGTFDQAGNVWEWCADSWSLTAYKERAEGEPDPLMPGDGSFCVVRGGSWLNPAQDLHAACREGATASLRLKNQGFRCVLWTLG